MSTDWKAELEKLKKEPIRNVKMLKKTDPKKIELRKLMKLLKTQLIPVVEVFSEKGRTKTQQPHIHEHNKGYTLVLPVTKEGVEPIILRLLFEFNLTENGYVLKAIKETEKDIPVPEKIIEAPVTEEKIQDEIRDFLKERQLIILKLKREKT